MPPPPQARVTPSLVDELIEEILLRLPPDSPASLVRAALVCKRWCRLVSDAGFRRRFRQLHQTPPVLGFLCNDIEKHNNNNVCIARLVPAPSFSSCLPHADDQRGMRPCDARHGRVLLHAKDHRSTQQCHRLIVWNPITDDKVELPGPPPRKGDLESWNVAVLCAAATAGGECKCDHLDCHDGPFVVVLVGAEREGMMFSYTYSSEAGAWSEPTTAAAAHRGFQIGPQRSALVGNALYFVAKKDKRIILEYDFGTRQISVIELPYVWDNPMCPSFTTTEDGRPGFARVQVALKLCIWCRAHDVLADRWELSKVIQLNKLLPLDGSWRTMPCLVGSVEGIGVIFVKVKDEFFTIDLKSRRVTKVYDKGSCITIIVVPYASFYTPVLGVTSSTDMMDQEGGCNDGLIKKAADVQAASVFSVKH